MKKVFKTIKYVSPPRQIIFRNTREYVLKLLTLPNETSGVMVKDLQGEPGDNYPVYIVMEPKLLRILDDAFPERKWVGKSFKIVRMPRATGGRANEFKVSLVK